MRILEVAPPWLEVPPRAYGGTEWVVSGLADGLTRLGHDVTLIASGGSQTCARLETVFEEPRFDRLGDARVETVQALAAFRRRHDFDVIHDHTAAVGPALASTVGDSPPVVHTLHFPWSDDQVRLMRMVAPPVHLVAISHDQACAAPGDIPIAAVIHHGIPLERYRFSRHKGDYLLFVGRASHDKGPATAIEIALRLGRPLVLAIKIHEPDERRYYHEVLEPLITAGIEVVPNPRHEQKVDLMGDAAVVILPIQWAEPFGLVIPEANACGTPVVAFGLGAAPELVAAGRSGFVVPPGDVDGFCAAVERAPTLVPEECRRHVQVRFSVERMVADYERLFRSITTIDLRAPVVPVR